MQARIKFAIVVSHRFRALSRPLSVRSPPLVSSLHRLLELAGKFTCQRIILSFSRSDRFSRLTLNPDETGTREKGVKERERVEGRRTDCYLAPVPVTPLKSA